MENDIKEMLLKILANQAALYQKISIIENRSVTIFHPGRGIDYFANELEKDAQEVMEQIKQINNGS